MSLKHFIQITKPGIIFGNVLSVAGGFFLASKGHVDLAVFLAAMIGTSLVVASGCVFNNCIDRDIDIKMERTKNRVLVQGLISLKLALIFATVLGVAGVALLYKVANPLAALFAVIQVIVHLYYFLHLDRSIAQRNNVIAFVFTAIVIVLLVGLSLWIMFSIHTYMMAK